MLIYEMEFGFYYTIPLALELSKLTIFSPNEHI